MSKRKKIIYTALAVFLLTAAAFCVIGIKTTLENTNTPAASPEPTVAATPDITLTPEPTPVPTPTPTPYISPIDFDAQHEINSDIYAWIKIPGMNVDFQILQHPVLDDFYLDHNLDKSYGPYPGATYTQLVNKKDFSDPITILYAHNMNDGSYFGSLKNYRDPQFLEEHRDIIIYTPYATLNYKIFAAVVYTDELIPDSYDYDDPDVVLHFVETLDKLEDPYTQILDDVKVEKDDNILVLSTCIAGEHNHRYLVVAVREKDEQN